MERCDRALARTALAALIVGTAGACRTTSGGSSAKNLVTANPIPPIVCPANAAPKSWVLANPEDRNTLKGLAPLPVKGAQSAHTVTPDETFQVDACVETSGKATIARFLYKELTSTSYITLPASSKLAGVDAWLRDGNTAALKIDVPIQKLIFESPGSPAVSLPTKDRLVVLPLGQDYVVISLVDKANEVTSGAPLVGKLVPGAIASLPTPYQERPPPAHACSPPHRPISFSMVAPDGPTPGVVAEDAIYQGAGGLLQRLDICFTTEEDYDLVRLVQKIVINGLGIGVDRVSYLVVPMDRLIKSEGIDAALASEVDGIDILVRIPHRGNNLPNAIRLASTKVDGKTYLGSQDGVLDENNKFTLPPQGSGTVYLGKLEVGDRIAKADATCPAGANLVEIKVKVGTFSLTGDACDVPGQFEHIIDVVTLILEDSSPLLKPQDRVKKTWKGPEVGKVFHYNVSHHNTEDSWTITMPGVTYDFGYVPSSEPGGSPTTMRFKATFGVAEAKITDVPIAFGCGPLNCNPVP